MEIIDNINNLLGDDLKKILQPNVKLKIAASCFSIYAYEALKAELEQIDALNFIFTSPTFIPDQITDKLNKEKREFHIPKLNRESSLYGSEFEIRLKNELTQRAIAKECADWIRHKVQFRSNRTNAPMQQFACVEDDQTKIAYLPLSGFTAVDLGYQRGDAVSNFVNKLSDPAMTIKYMRLFEQIWDDHDLVTNIFVKDRFNYTVLCHTDLQRERGSSLGVRLDRINWGNFDLVVIDESHNFRNNEAFKDRETRYQKLMNKVIKAGVKTKVLMLSATPVNNRFNDLRNQLALAYEGESDNLDTKLRTGRNINEIFRRAQGVFNVWSKLPVDDATIGGKVQISLADMDLDSWAFDLSNDLKVLSELLAEMQKITPPDDAKLQCLKELIARKQTAPINPGNKKILIFTAFSDTAGYLYDNLAPYIKKQFNLHTAKVTGSDRCKSTLKCNYDFQSLLTLFSPIAKEKDLIMPQEQAQIDILIGTDCISEGQNLQDCDFVVNYDIHWNPVRIIQRFGRIDRIGSKNTQIQLVNFWPDISLDDYINLKARVESRMIIADVTATGDDNVLSAEANDLAFRKEQLQRLQDEVIDLEDVKTGVSITDLGLNDFRMESSLAPCGRGLGRGVKKCPLI